MTNSSIGQHPELVEGRAPSRPALRYFGGKWRLAPFIVSHFPEHACYVEPFGGAASVLLQKPLSHLEVYNDINGEAVNFFRVLREAPAALIAAVELTPYSREEFLLAQEPSTDPLERARRFFVWSWQGRGRAGVAEPGGWRFMSRPTRSRTPVDDFNNINHLWAVAKRLKQVQIENDTAERVIQRYDEPATLFYVDPPYLGETRSEHWLSRSYAFDMASPDEHRALAETLHNVRGMVVLSGYDSPLYQELYSSWRKVSRPTVLDSGGRRVLECLWLSPNVQAKSPQLFSMSG